jgi:hypothetical protein
LSETCPLEVGFEISEIGSSVKYWWPKMGDGPFMLCDDEFESAENFGSVVEIEWS